MKYDVIIVGAGPAGIFTAWELSRLDPGKKILLIEKGRSIEKRVCPKRETGHCANCKPCNITTGFSGAGAFSDGKLILSPEIGGNLIDFIPEDALIELIGYMDEIYLSFGADTKVYGGEQNEAIERIKRQAIRSNLKLVESRLRHIGTEKCYEIYTKIEKELRMRKIELLFETQVESLIIENKTVRGVVAGAEYLADAVVLAVGREGADWLGKLCGDYGIETRVGVVDIGVRVEVRNELMREVNEALYESKLVYYTRTFDDMARTFCQNPGGMVSTEYYDGGLAIVNGHSYKSEEFKTHNTNFAILVSNHFTEPFRDPIAYGKYIAHLANMLSGKKVIVQRFGDLQRGRRTTHSRLLRNNIRPTLKDAVPGDLSLVFPYRIMLDIKEMIEALDNIFPGMASDETLLYGVEVKFYSNRIITGNTFESSVRGLYAAGDGAGITRGLMQAGINGIVIGRVLAGGQTERKG
ncbi:MAG: FAD-dependent oxidoreductase [Spirochaetes bacterium GWF1_51_8]|nr:MAG: FAD-dependent oxidoreductase [Spirochaetes bacterium GWF1_51_8]